MTDQAGRYKRKAKTVDCGLRGETPVNGHDPDCPCAPTVGGLTEAQWIKKFGDLPGFCNPFDTSFDDDEDN